MPNRVPHSARNYHIFLQLRNEVVNKIVIVLCLFSDLPQIILILLEVHLEGRKILLYNLLYVQFNAVLVNFRLVRL